MKHRKAGVASAQNTQNLETFGSRKSLSQENAGHKDAGKEHVPDDKNVILGSFLEIQKCRVGTYFQILEILLIRVSEIRLVEAKEYLFDIGDFWIIYPMPPQS